MVISAIGNLIGGAGDLLGKGVSSIGDLVGLGKISMGDRSASDRIADVVKAPFNLVDKATDYRPGDGLRALTKFGRELDDLANNISPEHRKNITTFYETKTKEDLEDQKKRPEQRETAKKILDGKLEALELDNEAKELELGRQYALLPYQITSAENANKLEAQKIKQNDFLFEQNKNLIAIQKEKEAEQNFERDIISGLSKFAEYANAPANVKDSVVSGAKSVLLPYDKALRNYDAASAGDPKSISNFIHNANKIGLKNVRYDDGAKKFFIQGADGKDVEVTRGTIEDLTEKRSKDILNSTIAELRANTFVPDATAYTANNYIRKIGNRAKDNGTKVDYKNITSNVETVMSRATEREKIALVITTAGYQLLDGKLNQESKAMLAQSLVPLVEAQGFQVDIDENTGAVSVIDPNNNITYTDREFIKLQEEQSQGLRDQLDSLVPSPNAELIEAQQAKEREERIINEANLEAREFNVDLSAISQYVNKIITEKNLQDDGITEEYGRRVRNAIYNLAKNLRKKSNNEETRMKDIRDAYQEFINDTKLEIGGVNFSPAEETLFVDSTFLPKLIRAIDDIEKVKRDGMLGKISNIRSKSGWYF